MDKRFLPLPSGTLKTNSKTRTHSEHDVVDEGLCEEKVGKS